VLKSAKTAPRLIDKKIRIDLTPSLPLSLQPAQPTYILTASFFAHIKVHRKRKEKLKGKLDPK
jgi:hypothetical protein